MALSSCAGGPRRSRRTAGESAAEPAALAEPTPWETRGYSVEGRPLRLRSIGSGPVRVLWVGGIHGNEQEGRIATDELPAAVAARAGLTERITLWILEDVNPDGRAANRRTNAHGVDLNRNYPARNFRPGGGRGARPLSEPESRCLFDLLGELSPHLVLVAHSWSSRAGRPPTAINWDGPGEIYAQAWADHSDWPMVPSTEIHGTPGSLGSLVGIDRGIPILTMEWANGTDPRRAWADTERAVLAVLERAALQGVGSHDAGLREAEPERS